MLGWWSGLAGSELVGLIVGVGFGVGVFVAEGWEVAIVGGTTIEGEVVCGGTLVGATLGPAPEQAATPIRAAKHTAVMTFTEADANRET